MQKVKIDATTTIEQMVELTEADSPQYPLLKFEGFVLRNPFTIQATKANRPRKSERTKGNVEVLIASTKEGWAVREWPFSVMLTENGEELFDHRHLLEAVRDNHYSNVPVALYTRKTTGNTILDSLSNNSVMTLSGLLANGTDGTVNAVQSDYVAAVKSVIESENLPLTDDVVDLLLKVVDVDARYDHTASITTIRNGILDRKVKSSMVFNTTDIERKQFLKQNPFFGQNNQSKEDGVEVRMKAIDKQESDRYADDILKLAYKANQKDGRVRVLVYSGALCERQIEAERSLIIDNMESSFNAPIAFFKGVFDNMYQGNVKTPAVTISDLPIEIWAMPQIEGEEGAIRLV